MDKEKEVTEIRPIKNLKTMKVIEKILAEKTKVMVEDVAVDVIKILKGLKFNAMFTKGMDILLMTYNNNLKKD